MNREDSSDPEKMNIPLNQNSIDPDRSRFPCCIVWTPLPCLSWFLPFIGHMGIAMSNGVIRDFAGPYYVSEDDMAFGVPTKYWQLDPTRVQNGNGIDGWNRGVIEASEIYKHRMHNLCCDNCHSHVAQALNIMQYDGSNNWNMIKVWFWILIYGRYVNVCGFMKTWLPFIVVLSIFLTIALVFA